MALDALGENPVLCRIHAHKFYVLVDSLVSAVTVGQEVVDELVGKAI